MARIRRPEGDVPIPEQILAAAMGEFGSVGYEGASIKNIADKVGVTPAALYYHFKDKRELLFQSTLRMAQALVDACTIAAEDIERDPVDALQRYVRGYFSHQLGYVRTLSPMYTGIVHGSRRQRAVLSPAQLKKLIALERQVLDTLRSILEEGVRQGCFDDTVSTVTAFAIIGMAEHSLLWFRPKGTLSAEAVADEFARLALRIVGAKRPPRAARSPR